MLAPWADIFYAADRKWWIPHFQKVSRLKGARFTANKVWESGEAEKLRITALEIKRLSGLSTDRNTLHSGLNSGYQAINLAMHSGATKIILLGFDMKTSGKAHFFGDHPENIGNANRYAEFANNFNTIKPADYGIEIINCTRDTALTAFPRMDLDDAISSYSGNRAKPSEAA